MTRLELLERELKYHLKVYKGRTEKYQELKQEYDFYKNLGIIIYINNLFCKGKKYI